MRIIPLLVLLTAAGCRSTTAAPPAPSPSPSPPVSPAPAAEAPLSSDPTFYERTFDLDGDGEPESIRVTSADIRGLDPDIAGDSRINVPVSSCDGECLATLHVGPIARELDLQNGSWGGFGLHIIDIDRSDSRKELLLVQYGGDSEDPPFIFTAALYDGETLKLHKLWNSWGYGSGSARPDGEGSLVVDYVECPDAFRVVYELSGLELVRGPTQTERIKDPNDCAACPRVFVRDGDALIYKGEILRHHRGVAARAVQALALGKHEGTVTVEIREDKPEITYIDHIYAVVDGLEIAPTQCRGSKPAYCERDGIDAVLHPGDRLVLTFTAPSGALELRAAGHYVPCYTCESLLP